MILLSTKFSMAATWLTVFRSHNTLGFWRCFLSQKDTALTHLSPPLVDYHTKGILSLKVSDTKYKDRLQSSEVEGNKIQLDANLNDQDCFI